MQMTFPVFAKQGNEVISRRYDSQTNQLDLESPLNLATLRIAIKYDAL